MIYPKQKFLLLFNILKNLQNKKKKKKKTIELLLLLGEIII